MEHWPHAEHINVWISALCTFLPIKKVSQISLLPCCKLKMAQLCSLHNSISHTESKVKTISVLTLHISSQFCQLSDIGFITVTAVGGKRPGNCLKVLINCPQVLS